MTAKIEVYEIRKILVVSTAHLPRGYADELIAKGLEITQDTYGWQIYVPPADMIQSMFEEMDFCIEIENLRALARDLDCDYVRFDRDGLTLQGFPVFDW